MGTESSFSRDKAEAQFMDCLREFALKALASGDAVMIVKQGAVSPKLANDVQEAKMNANNYCPLTIGDIAQFYLKEHSADGYDGVLADHLEVVMMPDPEMGEHGGDPAVYFRRKNEG